MVGELGQHFVWVAAIHNGAARQQLLPCMGVAAYH